MRLTLLNTMKDWGLEMLSVDARKSLEEAVETYHQQIDMAAQYLKGRGFTKEAASTHRLGYVAEPMIGHEEYIGRLAIPYITPTGVVDLRFRAINPDDSPKYLSRSGSEQHIYNVPAFQEDSDIIAICEGELDTIVMHSIVGIPAVGMPGANAWKGWYARAFNDYRKVFILTDGDQAGKDMGKKIMQAIDVAIVISMPDNMDVNEVYLSEGVEGIRKRMGL
jgi:DNA primase